LKIKRTNSRGFFPESWYVAKITKIETFKTKYALRFLFWFEIKNEHGCTMKVNRFVARNFTEHSELGRIANHVLGEDTKEFMLEDLMERYITINLKKQIKRGGSYLNVVGYKKFVKAHLDSKTIQAPKTNNTPPPPSPDITPESILEFLKDPENSRKFAALMRQEKNKAKLPKKKDPKSMGENMENIKRDMEG
jgi:hypothetical protein